MMFFIRLPDIRVPLGEWLHSSRYGVCLFFVLIVLQRDAYAQAVHKVEVRVTAVSSDNIYLDKGKSSGIASGDTVILYAPGRNQAEARIVSVSKNNSRCWLIDQTASISIGIRGEVVIPEERLEQEEKGDNEQGAEENEKGVPEHPPWSRDEAGWDQNEPLLAPVSGKEPADRPAEFRGRLYTHWTNVWDKEYTDNRYLLGRIGSELWMENPFGKGGGLHFDAEFYHRKTHLDDAPDETENDFTLNRLSYHWGGTTDQPMRIEVGRFLQNEFPEFGTLDGVEWNYRTGGGDRLGISVGAMPEPFPDMKTGDDLQAAMFYRYVSNEDEDLAVGLGFQKSWHEGDADRDLLVAALDCNPGSNFLFNATAQVDYYGSGDELKSHGLELTELHLNTRYQIDPRHGFGVNYSHLRWPELLRSEFGSLSDEQVVDSRLSRFSVYTWQELWRDFRVDARLDHWKDQENSGNGGEVRLGFQDWLYEDGEVAFSVFTADGTYSSGPGLRVSARKYFPSATIGLSYDVAEYSFDSMDQDLTHHGLHADMDWRLSSRWSLSVYSDYRFGDEQNSFMLGIFLQWRF